MTPSSPKSGRKLPTENGPETLSPRAPAVESRTVPLTLGEVAEIFIAGCQRGSDEAIAFERGSAASGARDDDLAAALCEIINAGKRWGEPGYIAYSTLAQVWDNALAARVEENAR